TAKKPRVISQLYDFYKLAIRRLARKDKTVPAELIFVARVELVAMAMPFADVRRAINFVRERSVLNVTRICAQSHGSSQGLNAYQIPQLEDDRVRCIVVELSGVCSIDTANIAREFNSRALHAQTNSKIRRLLATGEVDRSQHPKNSALSEAPGHQNGVQIAQAIFPVGILYEILRLHPANLNSQAIRHASVNQSLIQALVGIFQLDVLTNDANGDLAVGVFDRVDQLRPASNVQVACRQVQLLDDHVVEALMRKHQRNVVDGVYILGRYDFIFSNVAEQCDFGLHLVREGAIAAA